MRQVKCKRERVTKSASLHLMKDDSLKSKAWIFTRHIIYHIIFALYYYTIAQMHNSYLIREIYWYTITIHYIVKKIAYRENRTPHHEKGNSSLCFFYFELTFELPSPPPHPDPPPLVDSLYLLQTSINNTVLPAHCAKQNTSLVVASCLRLLTPGRHTLKIVKEASMEYIRPSNTNMRPKRYNNIKQEFKNSGTFK